MAVVTAQEDEVSNVTLTKNSVTVTVYTASVDEDIIKDLRKIKPPTSSANRGSGPKQTKILDILIVEERITIQGFVDVADKSNLRDMVKAGGVISVAWDGETFDVNVDKLTFKKDAATYNRDEATEATTGSRSMRQVILTCVKGMDL